MKRLLNFGVSDPLMLGMGHPVADRIETLGRARPTTWRTRCLALGAMSVIALSTAPMTIAEIDTEVDWGLGRTITVIPDMTDTQIADLQIRLDKLSSGKADKEVLTQFVINSGKFVARYDAQEKIIDVNFNIPVPNVKEVMDTMPKWLERCKGQKAFSSLIERTRFSWGSATVQCNAMRLPKRPSEKEKQ